MANTNLTVRKGQCINFGNCKKADTHEVQEVNLGDDFICSECEAGLMEIKPKGNWLAEHKLAIIIAVVLLLGGIGAGGYFMSDAVEADTEAIPQNKDTTYTKESEVYKTDTGVKDKETVITKKTDDNGTVSVEGGKYTGQTKNGKPHGMGTIRYTSRTLIDSRDMKKRYAEAGQSITGQFEDGRLLQGKLYDSDGNQIETIIIGGGAH